ncbi:hypothetical protein PM082_022065 [Marasmius tenuissimus]|nr:hypothetical protein PM082_022065 [Marasmius tenuissimus]
MLVKEKSYCQRWTCTLRERDQGPCAIEKAGAQTTLKTYKYLAVLQTPEICTATMFEQDNVGDQFNTN